MSFLGGAVGAIGSGIGAIVGGIAGSSPDESKQNQDWTVNLDPNIQNLINGATSAQSTYFTQLGDRAKSQDPYLDGAPSQFAQMLQQYAQGGFLPNQQQIGAANQYAQNIFSPQQAQLNNLFQQAQVNTNRQAASMGRSVNDPILQAKLAQYQGQQQGVLSGQQGALAAQTAFQMPGQQLGYAQQLSNQAFQNSTNLLGLGSQILNQAQQFGLGTARRTGNQTGQAGGGFKGAITGAFQGAAGGLGIGQGISGGGYNWGGGSADPYSDIQEGLASGQPGFGAGAGAYAGIAGLAR